jgi:hypothetical protein
VKNVKDPVFWRPPVGALHFVPFRALQQVPSFTPYGTGVNYSFLEKGPKSAKIVILLSKRVFYMRKVANYTRKRAFFGLLISFFASLDLKKQQKKHDFLTEEQKVAGKFVILF